MQPDLAALLATVQLPLTRWCMIRLGSWEDAEDAASEVFLHAFQHWGRQDFADERHAMIWIYKIATNECIDVLRRQRLTRARFSRAPLSDAHVDVMDVEETVLMRFDLAMIGTLDPAWQQVAALAAEGYTRQEIAHRTGMAPSTVGVRLWRARAKMRAMMAAA